jgi:hypothetical protein
MGASINSAQREYTLRLHNLPNAPSGSLQLLMLVATQRLEGFDHDFDAPPAPPLLPEASHHPINHHDGQISDAALF